MILIFPFWFPDFPEDEMMRLIRTYKPGQPDLPVIIVSKIETKPKASMKPEQIKSSSKKKKSKSSKNSEESGRDSKFPISKNPETASVLAMAEANWDSDASGGTILPSDRENGSD